MHEYFNEVNKMRSLRPSEWVHTEKMIASENAPAAKTSSLSLKASNDPFKKSLMRMDKKTFLMKQLTEKGLLHYTSY